MKARHFEELSKQTGIQIALTPNLTFKNLLILGIMKFEETVKTIAESAAKEYAIECTLDKMMTEWQTIKMDVLPYKNTGKRIISLSTYSFKGRKLMALQFCIILFMKNRNALGNKIKKLICLISCLVINFHRY